MDKEELELIEKNAATILAGYIANSNYSSKHINEYISEAVDYAIELHKQIETKLVTHERIKLGTYNLKHTVTNQQDITLETQYDPTPITIPPYWNNHNKCLVCGQYHDNGNLPCPHSKFTSKVQI